MNRMDLLDIEHMFPYNGWQRRYADVFGKTPLLLWSER